MWAGGVWARGQCLGAGAHGKVLVSAQPSRAVCPGGSLPAPVSGPQITVMPTEPPSQETFKIQKYCLGKYILKRNKKGRLGG